MCKERRIFPSIALIVSTQETHCWNSTFLQCHHGECVYDTGDSNYACHCTPDYTGKQCSLRIATGTIVTTMPSASAQTTTTTAPTLTQTLTSKLLISKSNTVPTSSTPSTVPIHNYLCDKITTVINLVNQIPVNDTKGGSCASGSSATPEAFVLDHCNVTSSSKWKQGANIMEQCNDIPVYTPVATFSNKIYAPAGGLCGIFLGCLPNGFKFGVQQCGNLPTIIHVNYGGLFTMNPNMYYTVQ